jgi:hypothetical protein
MQNIEPLFRVPQPKRGISVTIYIIQTSPKAFLACNAATISKHFSMSGIFACSKKCEANMFICTLVPTINNC